MNSREKDILEGVTEILKRELKMTKSELSGLIKYGESQTVSLCF